jgi:hypothetical protein
VPEIAPEALRDFPTVRLAPHVEQEIAHSVEEASRLRARADDLENHAVSEVESVLDRLLGGKPMSLSPEPAGVQQMLPGF